jgi:hypothetical protein
MVSTSFDLLCSVPTTPTLCTDGTVGSSDGVRLLNLACDTFASLEPRSVYKDMLNNVVSLIDHVVMNHKNQTRTNGI